MRQITVSLLWMMLGFPALANATILFTDDFENHLYPNYSNGSCAVALSVSNPDNTNPLCYPAISTDVANSGTHSVKTHYTDPAIQAGSFLVRTHSDTNEVWMRWYEYTVNFVYPAVNKNMFTRSAHGQTYWMHLNSGTTMTAQVEATQDISAWCPIPNSGVVCNYFPNVGTKTFFDGHWFCIVVHMKRNTLGQADGQLDLFIDGTQTHQYHSIVTHFDGSLYNDISHYAQFGQGDRYIDDLAVGTTRTDVDNCPGTVPDTMPPAAPTGVMVTMLAATMVLGGAYGYVIANRVPADRLLLGDDHADAATLRTMAVHGSENGGDPVYVVAPAGWANESRAPISDTDSDALAPPIETKDAD